MLPAIALRVMLRDICADLKRFCAANFPSSNLGPFLIPGPFLSHIASCNYTILLK